MGNSEQSILNIKISDLKVGMYVILPENWFSHPFIKNRFKLTSKREIEKISNLGITEIKVDFSKGSIKEDEIILPEKYLMTAPKKWRPDEIVPKQLIEMIRRKDMSSEDKAIVVKDSSLVLMNRLLEDPSAENIKQAKQGIFNMVDLIISNDETSRCLLSLTNHDLYTYTHSVNVGFFSIILAKRLFQGSKLHNMRELGAGFFLHDIGKVNIDSNILNKPGRLDHHERLMVRQHPVQGANILSRTQQLSKEANIIVMQHHERYDGTGYPHQLKGKEIHLYARICSIADVYDALTSERSYKEKHPPFEALKLMREEMIHHFQKDLFEQFVMLFAE